jgi:8-hydroxy-5-deazaflavin:NADPH oxidoreductase
MSAGTRYAIVGLGNTGSALARLFGRARVEVRIANTQQPGPMPANQDQRRRSL